MKTIGEALREIVAGFAATESVRIALPSARGAVLAQDVIAGLDLPGFDHSAMDGYAVAHTDAEACLAGSITLPVHGESRAGGELPSALRAGHAMRIFTGAPMPAGADTVVIQEDVDASAAGIALRELGKRGSHIRTRGSDVAQGSVALRAGQVIGPGEIGLLAALNCAQVAVHRKPRVAILCTGDELRELGATLPPGTLVNSNAYMLAAQIEDAGCEARVLPQVADSAAAIAARVDEALRGADVLLTSGGVSVGDHDYVAEALERAGVTQRFWKVAMKPGKPLLFGARGRVPVIGLPGNPVSAFVGFEVFVRPALAAMRGVRAPFPQLVDVVLDHDHSKSKGRPELARGQTRIDSLDSRAVRRVSLHARQGSGSLPSIAAVDVLVLLPGDAEQLAAGTRLRALPIGARAALSDTELA